MIEDEYCYWQHMETDEVYKIYNTERSPNGTKFKLIDNSLGEELYVKQQIEYIKKITNENKEFYVIIRCNNTLEVYFGISVFFKGDFGELIDITNYVATITGNKIKKIKYDNLAYFGSVLDCFSTDKAKEVLEEFFSVVYEDSKENVSVRYL